MAAKEMCICDAVRHEYSYFQNGNNWRKAVRQLIEKFEQFKISAVREGLYTMLSKRARPLGSSFESQDGTTAH